MPFPYVVAVSTENTPYMAWQTQLFCYSAKRHLGVAPIVVVHQIAKEDLLPALGSLEEFGCEVITCKSYTAHPLGVYPPRNEIGSLVTVGRIASSLTQPVFFCEPDFVFRSAPVYTSQLAGEYYDYLDFTDARVRAVIARKCLKLDSEMLNQQFRIGVPYLLPLDCIEALASRWLEMMDAFQEVKWIDIMYAFGLAAAANGLAIPATRLMDNNHRATDTATRPIIHYCYGDEQWDKRQFRSTSPLLTPPLCEFPIDSIGAEIARQIAEASLMFNVREVTNQ